MVTHSFNLNQAPRQNQSAAGWRVKATKQNFPILQGMSFYKLHLEPKAVREPHWHANADELGYCLSGNVLITLYADYNSHTTFLVSPGEVFLIPSGTLHAIENVGQIPAEIILQFSNEEPEDFSLSAAMGMFSDAVLGNTWDVTSDVFKTLKRSTKEVFAALMPQPSPIPKEAHYSSIYRYNLNAASPLISCDGGQARVARHDVWPILKRQALYSLLLTGKGMREPHWHPETGEMGYVQQGRARMSIQAPSGSVDTYELNEGEIYFIPKAYPHHIENLTDGPMKFLIFFDNAMPGDIGFTASVKSYSDETLSAVLGGPKDFFAKLPTYYKDLFIVNKKNPLDP